MKAVTGFPAPPLTLNLQSGKVMTDTSISAGGLNLMSHRAGHSVWDRRGWDGSPELLTTSRLLIGIGGGALAVQGLRSRSWIGGLFAGLGATLAWWSLARGGDFADVQRWADETLSRFWGHRTDLVADASADSFPASDAPAWTPTVGTGVRRHAVGR
jgi:hypothetical protein